MPSIDTMRSRSSARLPEAWTLRHNVTIHDAVYVALTRQLDDAALVTTDENLARAPGLGVETITPDEI